MGIVITTTDVKYYMPRDVGWTNHVRGLAYSS